MKRLVFLSSLAALLGSTLPLTAQTYPTNDPVVRRMWEEGMERSQARTLAQTLFDELGPRLTGTPGKKRANDWVVDKYAEWGIEAENQEYGTWMQWERGRTHVDLVEPRVRTLEAMLLSWSPGTGGQPLRAEVVTIPDLADEAAFEGWLPSVRGKFVAIAFAQPTCRPDADWDQWATEPSFTEMREARTEAEEAWRAKMAGIGLEIVGRGSEAAIARRMEAAGAAGIIASRWSRGWGAHQMYSSIGSEQMVSLTAGCEDYGLLHRLAENGQGPVIEVVSDAELLGEGPVFNTIGRIPGTELPNEYIVLSAHFDSWDAASGATDNGTGTLVMLEAMRILKAAYPNPRRTIIVGHWGGEEQGLNGSRAYTEDNPEVVQNLQALFNQDNGTGRIIAVGNQGLIGASGFMARWFAGLPAEFSAEVDFSFPGMPGGGGSDYASFVCYGAPAFSLRALNWSYSPYTWHTNRDTFDKVVFSDLQHNATLYAMLTYMASEETERVPRDRRTEFPVNATTGEAGGWPECQPARREWSGRR
ncbi:MAG: M20/M25/M40 family metallo-hydrolase [Vicinamibacterales bacterium]|jgi:hypothetical protein|nr:peptidase M28 [Acidobacteriota bacterium]MDP6373495.1 M20/M25/M40 family metallo-hydrolase [Vicinamibacterales bacterium]MDP6610648.1 M20/M25/M40 family metallo-hydrolase [Vicinamibacterales bacterium]|tara:strand:+ start:158 stop:1750 length:1593 start_codon:yes stop_codon:yes gene_type:complete